jgi:hypothetical protein
VNALLPAQSVLTVTLSEVSNATEVEGSRTASHQQSRYRFCALTWIPLPVQGEGKRAWRARVRAVATSTSLSTPCVKTGFLPNLLSRLGRATLGRAHTSEAEGGAS